ncbi:glycosyltransferase family 4 protein [soil metagenome]
MRVLVIAPHPFYEERGTPIAVNLLLRALVESGHDVEVLTLHLGRDVTLPSERIHRIRPWFPIRHVPPGLSFPKIVCDFFLFWKFVGLMLRKRYDVVHAVEEASFMALAVCPLRSTPYIVDMDSLMSTQIIDKFPQLRSLRPALAFLESLPIRRAEVVVPMCEALADEVKRFDPKRLVVLKDVSLRSEVPGGEAQAENLRETLGIDGRLVLYIGNLEKYQGLDLLLGSFALVRRELEDVHLVIIGGSESHISRYRAEADRLGLGGYAHFPGPRPVSLLDAYLSQADVLVSPRVHGLNTPMKVYSYLDSGVAVLATDLPTHTQVMTRDTAALAHPDEQSFAREMLRLLADPALRERLAANARQLIEREHSYKAFKHSLGGIYQPLQSQGA